MIEQYIKDNTIETSKIDNSKLSEYLNLLTDEVSNSTEFYPNEIGYINENNVSGPFLRSFIELKKNNPLNSVTVIKGSVGKGKSSFIEWWIKKYKLTKYSSKININTFRKRANISVTDHIYIKCVEDLRPLLSDPRINAEFDSKVVNLAQTASAVNKDKFKEGFISQSKFFKNKYPHYNMSSLLCTLICSVYKVYHKSIWIIIDNVDLENKKIQNEFIRDTFCIHEEIINKAKRNDWKCAVHFFLTIRPETGLPHRAQFKKYVEKSYPDPDVLSIANNRMKDAMEKVVKRIYKSNEFNIFPIRIHELEISSLHKLNELILKNMQLEASLLCTNWCGRLVSYNVRRFINSWVRIINSKNFIDYISNPSLHSNKELQPQIDPYLRFLIKGKYNYFPGNNYIDGESPESPLFFNLFGLSYEKTITEKRYIKNYLIFIRIIQYLEINKKQNKIVLFDTLKNDLLNFFDIDYIVEAVKILLWAHIIEEVGCGIRNIYDGDSYKDINLENANQKVQLLFTDTSSLYINSLVYEYEYLSSMSFVSYQIKNKFYDNIQDELPLIIKYARLTLAFLTSWNKIIINNMSYYKKHNKLKKFINIFNNPNDKLLYMWEKAVKETINKLNKANKGTSINMNIEKIITNLNILLKEGLNEINNIIK